MNQQERDEILIKIYEEQQEMKKNFKTMQNKQDKMEETQNRMQDALDKMLERQDKMEKRQDKMEKRQGRMEVRQDSMEEKQDRMQEELTRIGNIVAKMEYEHGRKLDLILDVLIGHTEKLEEHERRFEKNEKIIEMYGHKIYEIEQKMQA